MTLRQAVLAAQSDAVSHVFAERAPGCAQLAWRLTRDGHGVDGQVTADVADEDVPAELARWAAALGLTEYLDDRHVGYREYRGTVEDLAVTVWGVIDRDAFHPGSPR